LTLVLRPSISLPVILFGCGLQDFAGQVAAMEELKQQDRALAKNTVIIDQMYQLLQQYKVR
jgi:hypothetical protein